MIHVLLAYRRSTSAVLDRQDYEDAAHDEAWTERKEWVRRYLGDSDVEVVLLSAESKEDLVRTHTRYFRSPHELTTDHPAR
jgi:hypothetical protein